jgi:hypothetical protein
MAGPPPRIITGPDLRTGPQLIKERIRKQLDSIRYKWDDFAVVGGCPIRHPLCLNLFNVPEDYLELEREEYKLRQQRRVALGLDEDPTDDDDEEEEEEEEETDEETDDTEGELGELTSSESTELSNFPKPEWRGIYSGSGERPLKIPKLDSLQG